MENQTEKKMEDEMGVILGLLLSPKLLNFQPHDQKQPSSLTLEPEFVGLRNRFNENYVSNLFGRPHRAELGCRNPKP